MVNAIGQYVGPNRHVGHMHDRKPIPQDGFECRTSLGDGWWEAEIKFPFASLGYTPAEGDQWKTNVVRVSSQDLARGEQFTSWPHIERFHFHERSQFNRIVFRGQVLTAEEVTKLEAGQNQEFDEARLAYDGFMARAAAFEEKARGKPNLAASAAAYGMGRNVNLILRGGGEGWSSYGRMPQVGTIYWKEPVELNAIRVQWGSRKEFPDWYGIEWYDGESYRPLAEVRDNRFEAAAHEFEPLKTTRLRLTVFKITGGSTVTLAKLFEAFKL
jgi:hypothetical protein